MKKIFTALFCILLLATPLAASMDITRAELADELVALFGLEDEGILYFSDNAAISNIESVAKAVRAGLMEADPDGAFNPERFVNEDEYASLLAKFGVSSPSELEGLIVKGNSDFYTDAAFEGLVYGGNIVVHESADNVDLENCIVLGNVYSYGDRDISFSSSARVLETKGKALITLGETAFLEYLFVWGDDSSIILDGADVGTIAVYGKNVTIEGEGSVERIRANGDGLVSAVIPDSVTVGDMVGKEGLPVIGGEIVDPSLSGPAESPDKDKIIEIGKDIPAVKEIPSDEGVTFHDGPIELSHPFSSMYCSTGHVDISEYGYIEKEFLIYGNANVYNLYPNDVPYAVSYDNPYCTRILVRYPDPAVKEFSGNVVFDILNASSAIDLEDFWRRGWDYIMESGDAYVGITSQSGAADALKNFDAERYADINWMAGGVAEDGLFFDMLTQMGNLIKNEPELIFPESFDIRNLILTGQSWSGDYINTYLSVFYDYFTADGPLFDAYLALVNPAETFIATGVAGPVRAFITPDEPYISIMSQGEHYFGSYGSWYLDFEYTRMPDTETTRFYEVAGSGHSDPVSPIIPNSSEIEKGNGAGRPPKEYNAPEEPSDLQLDEIIRGALDNLKVWLDEGIPAPSADTHWLEYRTVVDSFVGAMPECVLDENGNAIGGIRMPQMEAPIAMYKPFRNDSSTTDGSMVRFSQEKLAELYPAGYEEYKAAFNKAALTLYEDRYITEEDYTALINDDSSKAFFE